MLRNWRWKRKKKAGNQQSFPLWSAVCHELWSNYVATLGEDPSWSLASVSSLPSCSDEFILSVFGLVLFCFYFCFFFSLPRKSSGALEFMADSFNVCLKEQKQLFAVIAFHQFFRIATNFHWTFDWNPLITLGCSKRISKINRIKLPWSVRKCTCLSKMNYNLSFFVLFLFDKII